MKEKKVIHFGRPLFLISAWLLIAFGFFLASGIFHG